MDTSNGKSHRAGNHGGSNDACDEAEKAERSHLETLVRGSDPSQGPQTSPSSNADDTEKAIEFLHWMQPQGPWLLVSFDPAKDSGPDSGICVYPPDAAEARAWIEPRQGNRNIYFHVNEPAPNWLSKANRKHKVGKDNLLRAHWLHVDVDPRTGHDIASEQSRILSALQNPSHGIERPTLITFSGGGYQAFWKLEDPYLLQGDKERIEEFERYNRYLAQSFGGDNCHNVDRIMRLPFTINVPDAKKKAKGRVSALARVVEQTDVTYPLGAFTQAPAANPREDDSGGRPQFEFTLSEAIRTEDLSALDEWHVSDRLKQLINQGDLRTDEGPKNGNDSDSEWLFDCVCGLMRAGVAPEVIFGLITDPNYAISRSVLKKGRTKTRYANRQLNRAMGKINNQRPKDGIVMEGDALSQIVDQAEAALIRHDAFAIFQQSTRMVRVVRQSASSMVDGVRRPSDASMIVDVSATWLREQMQRSAQWFRKTRSGFVPGDPDKQYADTLLARVGWNFPSLRGIVRSPTIRSDGSIAQTPGYDEASGLILDFPDGAFPRVPDEPSQQDARTAIELLEAPFRDFPFENDAARSVVIAAVLTGIGRHAMRSAPLFAIDAPSAGSGKSLISETIGIVVCGHEPPAMAQGKTAEEDEKRLVAALRRGDSCLLIDNCERRIEGDFLCSMLTQQVVQARILSKSEDVLLPTNVLVMATGNNIGVAGDMSRRMLRARINAGVERPDAREFTFDPRDEARRNRGALVAAALTILRAYICAGRPVTVKPYGSFGDFDAVRGALIWLGRADPLITREAIADDDVAANERSFLFRSWRAALAGQALHIGAIEERTMIAPPGSDLRKLYDLLRGFSADGDWNAKKIGWRLRRYKDTISGSLQLRGEPDRQGSIAWQVVEVGNGEMPF